MSGLYNPERIQKIGEILPGLCSYAEKGDEIHLGLDGDPEFPAVYRGSRPTGIIEDIQTENDATIITARFEDGSVKKLSSRTISAFDSWEFTDKCFEKVKQREESKTASLESDYRGTNNEDYETKIARIESELTSYGQTQDAFRKTVITTLKEIANDVSSIAKESGYEPKFCSYLTKRYDEME